METFSVVRETPWVTVYMKDSGGVFVDSKFRVHAADPSPDRFISAWKRASTREREELEGSLRYCSDPEFLEKVLDCITKTEPKSAESIRRNNLLLNGDLPNEMEIQQILELTKSLIDSGVGDEKRRLICETPWFRVWGGNLGISYEPLDSATLLGMSHRDMHDILMREGQQRQKYIQEFYGFHKMLQLMREMGTAIGDDNIERIQELMSEGYRIEWGTIPADRPGTIEPAISNAQRLNHRKSVEQLARIQIEQRENEQ